MGRARAEAVKDYMVDKGADPSRIMTTVNCDLSDEALVTDSELSDLNQRVHFVSVILNPDEMNLIETNQV